MGSVGNMNLDEGIISKLTRVLENQILNEFSGLNRHSVVSRGCLL
jgi:hypothetical protein